MKILVINAGSSSLKFQLFEMEEQKVVAKGNVERINDTGSFIRYFADGKEYRKQSIIENHKDGLNLVIQHLTDSKIGVIKSVDEINAFGHRVVNVGEEFFDSCVVTKKVLAKFKENIDFSPLHNPGAFYGLEACMEISPNTTNVAVFDIGFHKTLSPEVYRYAIPKRYYDKYKIRRYGAHGTSHYYVSKRCAELMGKDINTLNIITCHIGSGASITAVKNGKSVETSMGFTPLEGIIMNTRSGDIDPAVVEYICKKENKTPSEVINMFNKESGLLGITGDISDMRDLNENASREDVQLAYKMYVHRAKKYIGAYAAVLGGVDAIVFTAGIGENQESIREDMLEGLDFFGASVDTDKNWSLKRGETADISAKNSKVKVFVIPTDEERVIAEETYALVNK